DGDTPLHAASMDNRTEMVGITYQDGRGYQCPKLQRQDTRAGNRRQAHKGTALARRSDLIDVAGEGADGAFLNSYEGAEAVMLDEPQSNRKGIMRKRRCRRRR